MLPGNASRGVGRVAGRGKQPIKVFLLWHHGQLDLSPAQGILGASGEHAFSHLTLG